MEPGGLEGVSPRRRATCRRLAPGFPAEFEMVFDEGAGAFDAVALEATTKPDRLARVRLDRAFDAAVLKDAFEGIVTEFSGEPGSVECEFEAIVVVVLEILQVRDPFTGRALGTR